MKKTLLTMIVLLALPVLACGGSIRIPATPPDTGPAVDREIPPSESDGDASIDTGGLEDEEICLTNESFHPAENLCFIDGQAGVDLFFELWNKRTGRSIQSAHVPSFDEEIVLVTYRLNGDDLEGYGLVPAAPRLRALQEDRVAHEKIWDYFTAIIPREQRALIVTYVVVTDGPDGILASVSQDQSDPALWSLEVDIADSADVRDLTATLVHEFGHLLTLNSAQVPPDPDVFNDPWNDEVYARAEAACPTYFPGEGCSLADSYINAFFQRFWQGRLYREWLEIDAIPNDDDYYDALDGFFYRYTDQFVNDYAVTNPSEDIAETWTYFVLSVRPRGTTVAEQKILFFYEYPELVRLREQILARIASRLLRME